MAQIMIRWKIARQKLILTSESAPRQALEEEADWLGHFRIPVQSVHSKTKLPTHINNIAIHIMSPMNTR
jgi:hypothetical protein